MSLSVDVSRLRVDYGDVTALSEVDFSIEPGKIVGLLGRNGAGKTSLVSVLASFRPATAGTVRVDGKDAFENADVMANTCLIREGGDLPDEWRVAQALNFTECMRSTWDESLARKLLDLFELPTKKRIRTLSRGQRSALGVVLGMASRSPLTIFDEVHLGMDAPSRYAFYEALLADYLAHPRTIILSTHLIDEVSSLLEDVLILDKGRVLLHESAEDVRERGVALTGPAEEVERFSAGMTVLNRRDLGGTRQVTLFGQPGAQVRREAKEAGLEMGSVPLQDLFVGLTNPATANEGDQTSRNPEG